MQYAWGYLPVPGRHVMMYLDLIGRVAGLGDNKVMDLDPPPLNGGIILSLGWVILRERKRSDAMGKMVVVVVVVVVIVVAVVVFVVEVDVDVVELIFLNNNYCWQP